MKHVEFEQGKAGTFILGCSRFRLAIIFLACSAFIAISARESDALWEKSHARDKFIVSKAEYRDVELELVYESAEKIDLHKGKGLLSLPSIKDFAVRPTVRVSLVGSRAWVWVDDKLIVNGRLLQSPEGTDPLPPTRVICLPRDDKKIRWEKYVLRELSPEKANRLLCSLREGEDFSPIFTGRNLDGWTGALGSVRVQDEAIVWQPKKAGVIYTQAEYSDFIVAFEFKLPRGGNNGLAIRYPGKGDPAYTGMCESQILDDDYETVRNERIDARQIHGSAYGMVAARRGCQRPIGEWNYQEVTVIGSTIKVELNGTVILDADLAKVTHYQGGKAHPGKNRKRGHLGFAGHNDPVMFRNISLKALDTAPSAL
ncbi:MAG: DUF1080 domain-containing protein [Puniceicoccales bacterium]|jgi:hypothetical protein|nr:DUF1080 domain-containing protein [Puniceicoccales bacterium]